MSIALLLFVACPDTSNNGDTNNGNTNTVDTTAPDNVIALRATIQSEQVELRWARSNSLDYSGVTIAYRSGAAAPASCAAATGVTLVQLDSELAVTRTIAGLSNGMEYSFRVCAKDSSGNSAAGVTTSASLPAPTMARTSTVQFFGDGVCTAETDCIPNQVADGTGYFSSANTPTDVIHEVVATGGAAGTDKFFRVTLSGGISEEATGGIILGADGMATADLTGYHIAFWLRSDRENSAIMELEGVTPMGAMSGTKSGRFRFLNVTSEWKEFSFPVNRFGFGSGLNPNAINKVIFILNPKIGAHRLDIDEIRFVPPPDETAPGNVTDLGATAGAARVTLRWTKPSDRDYDGVIIAYYQDGFNAPFRCGDGFSSTRVWVDGADAVMHVIIGLKDYLQYNFRVCAKDPSGNLAGGVVSRRVTPLPDREAPSDVSSLRATAGVARATLTWTKPSSDDYNGVTIAYRSGATAPAAKCAAGAGVTRVQVDGADAVMRVVLGLAAEQHSFRVCAKDNTGNLAAGVTASATPLADTTAPGDVGGLSATGGVLHATLRWTKPSADDYNGVTIAYRSGATAPADCATGTVVQADGAATVAHAVTGLTGGTQYSFRVCAKDGSGNLAAGVTASATPSADTTAPGDVTALTATVGAEQVTLSWRKPRDADYNGVTIAYRSGATAPTACATGTGVTLVQADGATTVMHMVTGLTAGTQYSFRVCAKDNAVAVNRAAGVTASATPRARINRNCNSAGSGSAVELIFGDGSYMNCTTHQIDENRGYFSFASIPPEISHTVVASGGADGTSSFYRLALVRGTSAWGRGSITLGTNLEGTANVTGDNIVLWLRAAEATSVNILLEGVTPMGFQSGPRSIPYTITGITDTWKEFTIPIASINLQSLMPNAINKVRFDLNDVNGGGTPGIGVQTIDIDEIRFVMP